MINGFVLASAYSCRTHALLPSALEGLTAEFGMGSGVTPPLETPGQNHQREKQLKTVRKFEFRSTKFETFSLRISDFEFGIFTMGISCPLQVTHEQYAANSKEKTFDCPFVSLG